jgi:predicted ATPase
MRKPVPKKCWPAAFFTSSKQIDGYQDTEHYRVARDFLADPERFLTHLFGDRD